MSDPLTPFEQHRLSITFADGCWHHSIPVREGADMRTDIWRKGNILGRGSYGTLMTAKGKRGTVMAIKEVTKATTSRTICSRELQALVMLNSYPNHFVEFFGWWEDVDSVFFAMEYIEGGDLLALIHQQDLTELDAKAIVRQLLDALQVMHGNNICHRDLKPKNVLVVSSAPEPLVVKLADFGCAKYSVGTQLRTTVGTDGYIAPEVYSFGEADTSVYSFKVDVWSLGCLVYTVLTKKPPFPGFREYFSYTEHSGPFPSEPLTERNVSQSGIHFIMRLLAPSPHNRDSVVQASRNLWLVGGEGVSVAQPPTVLDHTVRHSSGLDAAPATHVVEPDRNPIVQLDGDPLANWDALFNPDLFDPTSVTKPPTVLNHTVRHSPGLDAAPATHVAEPDQNPIVQLGDDPLANWDAIFQS